VRSPTQVGAICADIYASLTNHSGARIFVRSVQKRATLHLNWPVTSAVTSVCTQVSSLHVVNENHSNNCYSEAPAGTKCPVCSLNFTSRNHFIEHFTKRHGNCVLQARPFKCNVCERSFILRQHLSRHMRHAHERVEGVHMCTTCHSTFTSPTTLAVHMRSHMDQQSYVCVVCARSFGYESSLRAHMYTHTADRPYKCEQCTSTFIRSSHLRQHMFAHTDKPVRTIERPFVCAVCGKRFAYNMARTKHQSTCRNSTSQVDE
jgi:DNA-directed RNA polymerase subunit RPC12/RpoP